MLRFSAPRDIAPTSPERNQKLCALLACRERLGPIDSLSQNMRAISAHKRLNLRSSSESRLHLSWAPVKTNCDQQGAQADGPWWSRSQSASAAAVSWCASPMLMRCCLHSAGVLRVDCCAQFIIAPTLAFGNAWAALASAVRQARRRLLSPLTGPAYDSARCSADVDCCPCNRISRARDRGTRGSAARKHQPCDADPNQNQRHRIFPDFPTQIAQEFGCWAVPRIVDQLINHSSGSHPVA